MNALYIDSDGIHKPGGALVKTPTVLIDDEFNHIIDWGEKANMDAKAAELAKGECPKFTASLPIDRFDTETAAYLILRMLSAPKRLDGGPSSDAFTEAFKDFEFAGHDPTAWLTAEIKNYPIQIPRAVIHPYTENEVKTLMQPDNAANLIPDTMLKNAKTRFEISQMLTLSTAHLSRETREAMSDPDFIDEVAPAIYPKTILGTTYGWFVYMARCADQDDEDFKTLPEDLTAAIALANKLNCSVICFDADADPVENLTTYND